MKFIAVLVFILVFTMPVVGQDTLREYYENGQIRLEYLRCNNQYDGLCKRWYPNGQRASLAYFADGQLNGPSISWYENGRVESVMFIRNGYRISETLYDMSGKLLLVYTCSQKRMIKKMWVPNGKLVYLEKYRNGIPVSCTGTASLDDTVDTEITCRYLGQPVSEKNGVFRNSAGQIIPQQYHGYGKTWSEKGKPQGRYFYRNGQPNGTWTEWDEKGKIIHKEVYRKGILKKELLE